MIKAEYDIHKNRKVYFVSRDFILQDEPLTKEKITELFATWVKVANIYFGNEDGRRRRAVLFCGKCKFKNVLKDMDKAEFLFFARNFIENTEYYCLNCGTYYGFSAEISTLMIIRAGRAFHSRLKREGKTHYNTI